MNYLPQKEAMETMMIIRANLASKFNQDQGLKNILVDILNLQEEGIFLRTYLIQKDIQFRI
jgi:predicted ribonuclease YlaK